MKIELTAQELDIVVQAMMSASIKGEASVMFGALLQKLAGILEKEVEKLKKQEAK